MKKEDAPVRIIPFRLPGELVKRLDKYVERLSKERPGSRVTRADAVRLLLIRALDVEEKRRD